MNRKPQAWKLSVFALIVITGSVFAVIQVANKAKVDAAQAAYEAAMDMRLGIQYTTAGTPELIDIFMPKVAVGHMPIIVYIHGGGWLQGDRSGGKAFAKHFLDRGYVFCSIDYRLSGVAKYPAQIEDCKCAIRFLRANADKYHIDPNQIGVWGHSAGGHLGALLGTTDKVERLEGNGGWPNQSSQVQAIVDWYGPTDLRDGFRQNYTHPDAQNMIPEFLGDPINEQLASDASPVQFVAKGQPPFLIMHGDQDPLVPISQSQELYDKLKAVGNNVTFKVLPGAGHGGDTFFESSNIKLVDDFFARTLKP